VSDNYKHIHINLQTEIIICVKGSRTSSLVPSV